MRWFRNPSCGRRPTICSPVNDDHTTFPAGAETVTFVRHTLPLDGYRSTSRGFQLALGSYIWCAAPFHSSCYTPLTNITTPFLHYLGGSRIRRPVRFLFGSSTRVCAKIHAYSSRYNSSYLSYFRAELALFLKCGLAAFVALHQGV